MNKLIRILIDKVGQCHSTLTKIFDVLYVQLNGDPSRFGNIEHQEKEIPKLLSPKEVQAIFDIKHSTYYRWINDGKLCPIVISKRHYHRKDDIFRILKNRNFRRRGGL